ncbi:protein-tyrosine kinase [Bifidobacterium callitrichos]|uniref:Protein-tyrosine kinase n=1 Tax=Bifidobacterium callitrichos TaxID=762209 RepID=A0A2T3G840_9BIFI|nr:polysaccharide biosynthesis tyrosine autokinase [Bifidobacterium callitrichos]PST45670.1 protein-tyrosine kinase [Bifidobacterium callitrichos]
MNEPEEGQQDGLTVMDLLMAVRKHLITAIVTLVIVVAAVAGYTFTRTPQYTATSELLATYRTSASSNNSGAGTELNSGASYLTSQIQTYPQLVKTESVLQPVIDDLGLNTTVTDLATTVTASNPTDTMLVDISVQNDNPKDASNIANAVAKSLKEQVTSTLYSDEGDKIVSPVNLTIVQQAYAPASPSSPNINLYLAVGVLSGIILGIVAALIKDLMDTRVRQDSDVTAIVDAPVLGGLTRNDAYDDKATVIIAHPASREAEEVRRLRTNVAFVLPDEKFSNVIVVTSAGPAEGKTTTSVNLATAFAENGSKVLLIDADVRNPSVSKKLDIEGTVGLTHLITNRVSSQDAIQRYWKPNFHVLPAGKQNLNPSILLNSRAMKALIVQVAGAYDYVIIDTAPMQVANDAAVFAKDGPELLLVAGVGVTEKKQLKQTEQELETLNIKAAGVAMNYVEAEKPQKSGYYYYGDDADGKGKKGQHGEDKKSKILKNDDNKA